MAVKTGLTSLLKAFQNAIMGAQEMMHEQHLNQIAEYVDEEGNAQMVKVKVPDIGSKDSQWKTIEVPKLVLCPPAALKIKKMKVRFKARMNGMAAGGDKTDHDVELHIGGRFGKTTEADVTIEFEGTDPPEGMVRINDELVKAIH
jgi:hypothetical protein